MPTSAFRRRHAGHGGGRELSGIPCVGARMPYRDDQAALEARRDELRRDLADATRNADALADAMREKESVSRELADVEARLLRARARRVPLLDDLRIASPCSASWDAMTGDDQVRFC